MSLPSTMKAYKCTGPDQASLVDTELPKLRPDYLLVKVHAVALNPTDWKHIRGIPTPGATVGCDFAGTVVSVGSTTTKHFSPGDRVAGFVHGVNAVQPEDGAFGEYCVSKADITIRIPDTMSFTDAATLGVGLVTIGQGLYQSLQLPVPTAPDTKNTPVLIYGGSTATGLFALQFAKLSVLNVITTCSARNFDLVKSYGADVAFDYSDPECARKIKEYTSDGLTHVFDCISEGTSPTICAEAISSKGGQYSALLVVKDFPREDVKSGFTLGYTVTGERFTFRAGQEFPAKKDDFEFGKKHMEMCEGLMNEGKVKAVPTDVRDGGLAKIHEGLDDLRSGRVSGRKIVYKVGSEVSSGLY
ncbi:hypothetical protein OHC33_001682 [Knufia fluminis]|uniref:Enoyl reductase (ER) domain-containing protein n=1 Tax=Knufia fluminis TaxID=191047 RepID=A0AAN8EN19_9EURO|nr:hypothetical protein OHC33_001682 [Knufia fluminis]